MEYFCLLSTEEMYVLPLVKHAGRTLASVSNSMCSDGPWPFSAVHLINEVAERIRRIIELSEPVPFKVEDTLVVGRFGRC